MIDTIQRAARNLDGSVACNKQATDLHLLAVPYSSDTILSLKAALHL